MDDFGIDSLSLPCHTHEATDFYPNLASPLVKASVSKLLEKQHGYW